MQVTVVVVSLATVGLWCGNTALRGVVGDQGIVAIFPLAVFFGAGILTKDDFNSFLWNIVMLAQVRCSRCHVAWPMNTASVTPLCACLLMNCQCLL